jgi:hypothetical protein
VNYSRNPGWSDKKDAVDTPFMLLGTADAAGFTAAKTFEVEPDSRWRYISGSPNLVCRIIREAFGGSLAHYFAFPRRLKPIKKQP